MTTVTGVNIPSQVTDQYTPTSTATSIATYGDRYTYITAYLAPSAVPLSNSPATSDFIYSYYIADCRNPTATDDSYYGPSSGGGSSGDDGDDGDDGPRSGGGSSESTATRALRTWVIVVIVILVLLVVLFFFGFLENFLWFRRLMLGKSTLRFGTISWILISLWVACFTRSQSARTPEDQARLKQQWEAMSGGTKWKLWWKWGFRHAYPVDLLGDPNTPGSAPMGPPQMQAMAFQGQPPSDPKNPMATAQPYAGAPPQQHQWGGQPMYQYAQPGQPVQGQYPMQFQGQPPQYQHPMQQQYPGYPMQYQMQPPDQSHSLSPQPTGTTTLTQTSQIPSPQTPSPAPDQGQHQHPHQQQ